MENMNENKLKQGISKVAINSTKLYKCWAMFLIPKKINLKNLFFIRDCLIIMQKFNSFYGQLLFFQ